MTSDGTERKARICKALFMQKNATLLTLHFYASFLPLLKNYVLLFQSRESLIHKLYDNEVQLTKDGGGVMKIINSCRDATVKQGFFTRAKSAYLAVGKYLLKTLPLGNKTIMHVSSLDPGARGHAPTLKFMRRFASLVPTCSVTMNLTDTSSKYSHITVTMLFL
ncbi:hypothetical protein CAPTEDRAFT_211394 [Capitella teleta]|uniref:Uncharacterized protein n=1 Tax=Capitella teleta TaxID=283909 RepID=R7TIH7_CAPTE|nr:hypothetical protein CAPTEDRAFT_211394 [Capitella teleta]|eukprot:ELT91321.1 hypothetical protein CAPTEDRAFT_211394 [Capitella teleta]